MADENEWRATEAALQRRAEELGIAQKSRCTCGHQRRHHKNETGMCTAKRASRGTLGGVECGCLLYESLDLYRKTWADKPTPELQLTDFWEQLRWVGPK